MSARKLESPSAPELKQNDPNQGDWKANTGDLAKPSPGIPKSGRIRVEKAALSFPKDVDLDEYLQFGEEFMAQAAGLYSSTDE